MITEPIAGSMKIDPGLLRSLRWRNIGPHRGGRVVAVAGDPSDSMVFYFGCAGGVWKTYDGGEYWENVSDGFFKTSAVGAIGVADSDPNVLYVGMGESCLAVPRFHWTAQADGVYRSTDAGNTWTNVGLKDTRHIARIRVHPQDPDLVYAAVLGHLEEPHHEKGVYRSRDGGSTWERVLFRSEKAGACDLTMDPSNPRILYAAMWDARRSFWESHSVGPDTSVYKTIDGGDTWTNLTDNPGLPEGLKGRIGIAASPAKTGRVWAVIEARDGGLFRSDDGGAAWEQVSDKPELTGRPHYYNHVFAHPQDPERVYVMSGSAWKSSDGGRTFTQMVTPHKDNHELWIDPGNPQRMIQSHDGGANVSFNGGASWSSIYNQPTSEFYHLATDTQFPYRVYGTQQDNTAISVPSRSHKGAIIGSDVYPVGSAESGQIAVRPDNSNIVYAGAVGSHPGAGPVLIRYDHDTGQVRIITVWPDLSGWRAKDRKYRFQWDFPIVISPHDPDVLYAAGNVLFRSTDEGTNWEVISPDLTRNDLTLMEEAGDPETTIFPYDLCAVLSFAESPVEQGVFWVGTDDGLVQLSRDEGKSWDNVTPDDMPEWSLVSKVEASLHDPASAYVAATRYKFGDYRPYLWKTDDFGKTWEKITAGISDIDFTRIIREDPQRRGLLYAGTEGGVYVSLDDGASWESLRLDMPPAPVHDMVIKDNDLVVATYGRGFWILDDLTPLHQITSHVTQSPAHLFKPRPSYRLLREPAWRPDEKPVPGEKNYFLAILGSPMTFNEASSPNGETVQNFLNAGTNPPDGVIVTYYLKEKPEDDVSLTFLDPEGQVIKRFSSISPAEAQEPPVSSDAGANRFVWDMRYPGVREIPGDDSLRRYPTAPLAPPGTYRVQLTVRGQTQSQSFEIRKDPRVSVAQDDLEAQFSFVVKIRDKVTEANDAAIRLREVQRQIQEWESRAQGRYDTVVEAARASKKKLSAIDDELIQKPQARSNEYASKRGFFSNALNTRLADLISTVETADGRPTRQSYEVFDYLSSLIDGQVEQLKQATDEDVPAFVELLHELNVPPIVASQ